MQLNQKEFHSNVKTIFSDIFFQLVIGHSLMELKKTNVQPLSERCLNSV